MALLSFGGIGGSSKLSLKDIGTEYGDTAPYRMSEFYQGAGLVTDNNANVPTTGRLRLRDFYGTQLQTGPNDIDAWRIFYTSGFGGASQYLYFDNTVNEDHIDDFVTNWNYEVNNASDVTWTPSNGSFYGSVGVGYFNDTTLVRSYSYSQFAFGNVTYDADNGGFVNISKSSFDYTQNRDLLPSDGYYPNLAGFRVGPFITNSGGWDFATPNTELSLDGTSFATLGLTVNTASAENAGITINRVAAYYDNAWSSSTLMWEVEF